MCRMIAVISQRPTELAHAMFTAPHSLCAQAKCDLRGVTHPDGWGIGWYDEDGKPHVVRSALAAFEDVEYRNRAEKVHARVAIAHARDASVGVRALANCHPFMFGPWMFAHNGTVTGFSSVRHQLEEDTDPRLLNERDGQTDSELVFFWLLSKLEREGVQIEADAAHRHADRGTLEDVVRESLHKLVAWCDEASDEPCKLNFYLTDGHVLLTTRWGHTQYRRDYSDVSGTLADGVLPSWQRTLVSSEPLDDGPWQEVPQRSILTVRITGQSTIHPL